jgi:hypothetical protein
VKRKMCEKLPGCKYHGKVTGGCIAEFDSHFNNCPLKSCNEAEKLWSQSGEAKNYTDPCDYCKIKCY